MEKERQARKGDTVRNFFGFDDAADEKDLKTLFFETSEFQDVKTGAKANGGFVVTGIKGSGKTAICRYLSEMGKHSLIWRVDNENRFLNVQAKDLGKYPSEVESVLLNLILSELIRKVVERSADFPSSAVESAKRLLPKISDHFMSFVKKTKIKAKFFEWDLEKILASGKGKFTEFGIEKYIDPLKTCFARKPALILFDDIDDTFLGADRDDYPTFVEGLLRAAKRINLAFGNHLHFIVFLKYGIFRAFYEKPRDYEKVRDYVIVLEWNEEGLKRVLAKRIADRFKLPDISPSTELWSKAFNSGDEQSLEKIMSFLFDRCASGPRDAIDFCNKAVEASGGPPVTLTTLKECESEFSRDKLIQIYEDYGYTYPDIHKLIEMCFQGTRAKVTNDEFRDFILRQVLGSGKVADVFAKYRYFETANVEQIIQILYTVGFIGYISKQGEDAVYLLGDPRARELFDAEQYSVHPAFRKALRITR